MKRNLIFAVLAISIGILTAISIFLCNYFYPKQYVKDENGQYINVSTAKQENAFPISRNTKFTIEHCYLDENRTLTEEIKDIPALLGCDKDGLQRYLADYLNHLSYEEQEKGLKSFELISYNKNQIHLRKIYKKDIYKGFIVKSFNGTIVILNGDNKTVYDYTKIPINILPTDLQNEVINGYLIETEEELYNFLENYSS